MKSHRNRKPRRGAAAVEFAFLAPVVFALLLGLWQVGRIIEVKQLMDNAAREGARLAAQAQIVTTTGNFTNVHTTTAATNQNFLLDFRRISLYFTVDNA